MKMNRYWAVRLGEGGKYVEAGRKGNYIAIGWSEIGDLTWLTQENTRQKELNEKYKKIYGGSALQVSLGCGMIWNFVREIKEGDVVLVPSPEKRTILVGEVKSFYKFKENWKDDCPYPHRRNVKWVMEVKRDRLSQKFKNSIGSSLTVFSLDHHKQEIQKIITGIEPERKGEEKVTGDKLATAVLSRLFELDSKQFEEFIAHLLSILGFEAATTRYIGDKGVDVIGTLNAEGLANITLRIQVKRIQGSLGIDEVLRIRGTLGTDEHGSIITTSKFTKQAKEEAQNEKRKSVALIDGEDLVDLILKYYDELDEKYKQLLCLKKEEVPLRERFSLTLKK